MRKKITDNYVRLPLQRAYNVRDLGGYAGEGRRPTKYHAFLRTDNLSELTKEDQEFLKDYGVTAAIDLRSVEEAERFPNPFREDPEVSYINIPFITEDIMDMRLIQEVGFHVPTFYKQLIESHELVYDIMTFIAKQKGCVLFHCMAGKDRTGVIAMMLLGLAGVSKQDIVANYQVTRTYLKDFVDLHLHKDLRDLEYSEAEWMEESYEYLINKYGSVEHYLKIVGLSERTVKKIRKKILSR